MGEVMNKVCQGCRAGSCLFTKHKREKLCCCIDCLVKVVCNQWCDKRLKSTSALSVVNRKQKT